MTSATEQRGAGTAAAPAAALPRGSASGLSRGAPWPAVQTANQAPQAAEKGRSRLLQQQHQQEEEQPSTDDDVPLLKRGRRLQQQGQPTRPSQLGQPRQLGRQGQPQGKNRLAREGRKQEVEVVVIDDSEEEEEEQQGGQAVGSALAEGGFAAQAGGEEGEEEEGEEEVGGSGSWDAEDVDVEMQQVALISAQEKHEEEMTQRAALLSLQAAQEASFCSPERDLGNPVPQLEGAGMEGAGRQGAGEEGGGAQGMEVDAPGQDVDPPGLGTQQQQSRPSGSGSRSGSDQLVQRSEQQGTHGFGAEHPGMELGQGGGEGQGMDQDQDHDEDRGQDQDQDHEQDQEQEQADQEQGGGGSSHDVPRGLHVQPPDRMTAEWPPACILYHTLPGSSLVAASVGQVSMTACFRTALCMFLCVIPPCLLQRC